MVRLREGELKPTVYDIAKPVVENGNRQTLSHYNEAIQSQFGRYNSAKFSRKYTIIWDVNIRASKGNYLNNFTSQRVFVQQVPLRWAHIYFGNGTEESPRQLSRQPQNQ